jgi:hypothetical protein
MERKKIPQQKIKFVVKSPDASKNIAIVGPRVGSRGGNAN